jgi:hypothetical protein
MEKNWIAGAIGKPGSLHKALHIEKDKKISSNKLEVKPGDSTRLKKMKVLAKTLKKLHKK